MVTRRRVAGRLLFLIAAAACLSIASCATTDPQMRGIPECLGPAAAQGTSKGDAEEPAPPTEPPPGESVEPPKDAGPLSLTVRAAILLALENNRSLRVSRYNVPMTRTSEQVQRAAFDPDLTAQFAFQRSNGIVLGQTGFSLQPGQVGVAQLLPSNQSITEEAGISEFFPTGTTVGLTAGATDLWLAPGNDIYASQVSLSATQSLLRGSGLAVNLASLREARLDTNSSEYELRGFAESLVAQTEEAYWDYALADEQISIFEKSLKLAQEQLDETLQRIRVGGLAETQRVAAEAELALRREDLINARSTRDTSRIRLLRLLNPAGNTFERELNLADRPTAPSDEIGDVAEHIQLAQRMRPDLNQARLQVERGELEIVKTKNGLLPKLDLFIGLGRTGYASTFADSARDLGGANYNMAAGLAFEYPLGNRAAEAHDARARLARDQAQEAVGNLSQLVEADVRSAYIEVLRTREQVTATAASRKLQEEKEQVEVENFRVGKSTSFLVAQAQRDLVASQIEEIQALVNYRKAFVELYRLEGSLLSRRGLDAPGAAPPSGGRPPGN
jgi:outer membrane protein TolC